MGIKELEKPLNPSTPKVKDVVIGLEKPKRLNKNPWKCRIKMGRGCSRKGNGLRVPKEEEMGLGSL